MGTLTSKTITKYYKKHKIVIQYNVVDHTWLYTIYTLANVIVDVHNLKTLNGCIKSAKQRIDYRVSVISGRVIKC